MHGRHRRGGNRGERIHSGAFRARAIGRGAIPRWFDASSAALLSAIAFMSISGCGRAVVDPRPNTFPAHSNPLPANVAPAPADGPILPMPQSSRGPGPAATLPSGLPNIPIGSVIDVPAESPAHYHEVVSGDTLSAIARRHGTTVERLLDANGLDAGVVLRPGQRLYVPGVAPTRSTVENHNHPR